MFVNIHNVPAGHRLYTVAVTSDELGTHRADICFDEVDVVAPSRATTEQILAAMSAEDRDAYEGQRVIGIVDQTDSYVVWENPASELRVTK